MARPISGFGLFGLAWLATLTGCSSVRSGNEGDALFERGDFHGARLAYEQAQVHAPDDAILQQKWKAARVFELLDSGRRLVFSREDFRALEVFELALEVDPQSDVARMWIDKTKSKITRDKIKEGFEALAEQNYSLATESFRQALLVTPGDEDALGGLVRIREVLDRQLARSEDYALRGVRDRAANLLYQADANFDKAYLYNPSDPDVQARGREVKHQLAEQKFLEAQKYEKEKHFGAALVGYRAVRSLDLDYPEIAERIASIELELKAEELLRSGKLLLARGEFEIARRTFGDVLKLGVSPSTAEEAKKKLEELSQRELAALYLSARTLEQGERYEEAAAQFSSILKKAPYYEDTIARLDIVRGVIAKAEELFAAGVQAEDAQEREKALKFFEEVFSFYPRFKDVGERIERLRRTP